MKKLEKDPAFASVVQLFLKDALKMTAHYQNEGIWISLMSLYSEGSLQRSNSTDYSQQIEDDMNEVANPLKWVIKIHAKGFQAFGMQGNTRTTRYEYRATFLPLGAILTDDQLMIDVIRYC